MSNQGTQYQPPNVEDFSAPRPTVALGAMSKAVFLTGAALSLALAYVQAFELGKELPRPILMGLLVAFWIHNALLVGFFPPYHLRLGKPTARCSNCTLVALASVLSIALVIWTGKETRGWRYVGLLLLLGTVVGLVPRIVHIWETRRFW